MVAPENAKPNAPDNRRKQTKKEEAPNSSDLNPST
jgi:hypothetical protein